MLHEVAEARADMTPGELERGNASVRADQSSRDCVDLCGLRLDRVTEAQAVERVFDALDQNEGGWIVTPNLDILRKYACDAETRRLVDQASLVVADGMPLVWASRLKGDPLPERVAGSTMIWTLCREAGRRGRSVFLLGGNEGAAAAASAKLREVCPDLKVAGEICPPFGFEQDASMMDSIGRALRDASPHIVFVALGSPKQELLIEQMRDALPNAWWVGVGISFSFISGEVQRAPRWMQRVGLEWFHRFLQEPGRLARRYFIDGAPFAIRLLISSFFQRFHRQGDTRA